MKRILFLIIFFPLLCIAQEFNFQFEPAGIPVEIDGWQPFSPWVGGISESNPAIVDIDGDEDLDFFVGEFIGYIKYFRNDGAIANPNYTLTAAQFDSIYVEEARANPCFRDLDNDGDLDLVVGDSDANVLFYRNEGTIQAPIFILENDNLVPAGPPWCWGPELTDIDADGDYDLFGGWENITFYRNEGTPDSFSFNLITANFAGINISGWASVDFIDIDSDNDYDLFIGEEYGNIWYYRNDGDSVNYDFVYVTDNFEGIDVGYYASPEFADVDGDGDFDLFVGSESWFSEQTGGIFFYENVGSSTNPVFEFVTKNYLTLDVGNMIDEPQLVDIDADEDADLFADIALTIAHFDNIGNSTVPSFQLVTETFEGIWRLAIRPCFIDLDADFDYDIFCGTMAIPGPPALALYLNSGTPENPDISIYDPEFITNPSFDVTIQPALADIDADGDYDLFVSDNDGHFFYYRNDGSPSIPNYTMIDSTWQGITFPYPFGGNKGFDFADLDEDGDLDLIMESPEQTNLYFYRNIGTPQSAVMALESEEFIEGFTFFSARPFFVDIDNDSDLDLFVGQQSGGIMFFRNLEVNSVNREPGAVNRTFTLHQNYPNPFNPTTTIPFTIPTASMVKIEVFNLLGQQVSLLLDQQLTAGSYQLNWDASAMSSGVYLIMLETPGTVNQARKVMLVK